jgi:hypothetical protein
VLATIEAQDVAEVCVLAALRKMHFSVAQRDAKESGTMPIEAWKGRQRIFVLVSTSVSPAEPRPLTREEEQDLRRQAARADGQPWEALVLLSRDLEPVRLDWRPLVESEAGE